MNDNDIQKLFQKMKAEKLSDISRARIRENLKHMMHAPLPTYSEFSFMRFMWVSGTRATVGVLAVAILVFGGVSYAANSALPGDVLYSLKTGFNEPVRLALSVSDDAKANYEAELTDRRLTEASLVASENKLDEGLQETLLNQAAEHATALRERLDKSSDSLNEASVTKLAARLAASRKVRNSLAVRTGVSADVAVFAKSTGVDDGRGSGIEATAASTAPAPMMMSVTASAPSADTTSLESPETESAVMLRVAEAPEPLQESPIDHNLKRVDEEYERALMILDARLERLSREKSRGGEAKGVTNDRSSSSGASQKDKREGKDE